MEAAENTVRCRTPRCTHRCRVTNIGTVMNAAYTGGSKIAVGSTQTVVKSRVTPPVVYIIRGVDATEITPQVISSMNFARSDKRQSVEAPAIPIVATATTGTAPTYKRICNGSCHHAQSLTAMLRLKRLVRDVACMIHRSVCGTRARLVVTAHRK